MRCICASAIIVLACLTPVIAVDLTKIERSIGKLPELRSVAPEYGLLVFGSEATTRVWLIHDGDLLYVDRNGNGDLTDAGERVEADTKSSKPEDGVYAFKVGDIQQGDTLHKDLTIAWINVGHMKDQIPQIARHPKLRGCYIKVDVALAGHKGTGIDGRVTQAAAINDSRGLLKFAAKPQDAPIIHFGGAWEITLAGSERWQVGRSKEVYLIMGTPGIGAGSTAMVTHEHLVPRELSPKLRVTFPSKMGQDIVRNYEFKRRCCYFNFYGDVDVPDEAAVGAAKVDVTFDGWASEPVASTVHQIQLVPPKPGPKLLPVSARLVSKLEHSHPRGGTCSIRFSSDGRRLFAGDYPGGVVHVWDVTTGARLTTIDMGEGFRGSDDYSAVSPDWRMVIAPTNSPNTLKRIERSGKVLRRVTYHDSLRVWDLTTGELRDTWQHTPQRGILSADLSPDGTWLFTLDEVPGEFETYRPRALSLWNVATGEHRQVVDGFASVGAMSPDGKWAAVSLGIADKPGEYGPIRLYSMPEFTPGATLATGTNQRCTSSVFLRGEVALGMAYTYLKPDDRQNFQSELKFWEVKMGKELFSVAAPQRNEGFQYIAVSASGRTIAATTHDDEKNRSRTALVDVATKRVTWIDFESPSVAGQPVFHPGGQWVAVPLQHIPKGVFRLDPSPEGLPQPSIAMLDVETGKVLEELVSPQCYLTSMAFSPDGKTLATSGTGAVLLWDIRSPPGKATGAVIGDTVSIEGTLVGGKPLDWAPYRGKVVLVDFWATWCKPCVAKIPDQRAMRKRYRDRGFEILGVSVDEKTEMLPQFIKDQDITWPIICGTSSGNSGLRHPLAGKFGVQSVPRSILLDRNGKLVAVDLSGDELTRALDELLKATTPTEK